MGTILSKIHDDYEEYVEYCQSVHELPVRIVDNFYEHWKKLKELHRNDLEE